VVLSFAYTDGARPKSWKWRRGRLIDAKPFVIADKYRVGRIQRQVRRALIANSRRCRSMALTDLNTSKRRETGVDRGSIRFQREVAE